MLELVNINLYTKFEVYSFTRSKDMMAQKFKNELE